MDCDGSHSLSESVVFDRVTVEVFTAILSLLRVACVASEWLRWGGREATIVSSV